MRKNKKLKTIKWTWIYPTPPLKTKNIKPINQQENFTIQRRPTKRLKKRKIKYRQKASIIITGQVNLNKKQTKEIKKGQKKDLMEIES